MTLLTVLLQNRRDVFGVGHGFHDAVVAEMERELGKSSILKKQASDKGKRNTALGTEEDLTGRPVDGPTLRMPQTSTTVTRSD